MPATQPNTPTEDKSTKVLALIQLLGDDLDNHNLVDDRRVDVLSQLKVYGRDPQGADGIYSDHGLATLSKYAFGEYSVTISQEALRVIANALLLQPTFRDKFAALGYTITLLSLYKRPDDNYEFLAGRILFLLTYNTQTDFMILIRSYGLAEALHEHLERHSNELKTSASDLSQIGQMALSETLKLVFNVANSVPTEISSLSRAAPPILTILSLTKVPTMPFDLPINTLVNALAILDFVKDSETTAESAKTSPYEEVIPKLIEILKGAVEKCEPLALDTAAIPLLTVLRKVYECSSDDVKETMRKSLLPDDSERDLPLGQSSTLAAKLLRLTSSPGLTNLPESISALLFELSDKDASIFVKNIGYGYAAGYLMTHKIPIPEDIKQDRPGVVSGNVPINPITGQRLDKESHPPEIEMTDEEKEREAERLFVLFERLRATGVVDVKNPVEQALNEGRFEELEDSDSDNRR